MENMIQLLRNFLGKMTTMQRMVFIGLPMVILIGGTVMIMRVVGQPRQSILLFADADSSEAMEVMQSLGQDGIEYIVKQDGEEMKSSIFVYVDDIQKVDLMRMRYHSMLPHGYDLFDKSSMGRTDRMLEIDVQRAMIMELERTLSVINGVQRAQVTIDREGGSSFLDYSEATAAINLVMRPGAALGRDQVQGLADFVQSAVLHLPRENITIIDQNGMNLMNKYDDEIGNETELVRAQQNLSHREARVREQKLVEHLEQIYGRNVSASVTVELDFDKISEDSTVYETPIPGAEEGLALNFNEERKYEKGIAIPNGGSPGVESNVPGYSQGDGKDPYATEKRDSKLDQKYALNAKNREYRVAPGSIKRMTASVTINMDAKDWSEEQNDQMRQLVAGVIGADFSRGDSVSITAINRGVFAGSSASEQLVSSQRSQSLSRVIGWLIAVLMLGLMFSMVRGLVSTYLPTDAGLSLATDPMGKKTDAASTKEAFVLAKLDDLTANKQELMREEIGRMIDHQPEQVVALIRTWIMDD